MAALGAYVLHRRRALVTPALRPEQLAAGAAILLGGGIWAAQLWWPTHDEHDQAPRATLVPGLSQARTIDGHVLRPEDLDDPAYCAQCHPAIAERWEASVHHFGSLNDPFYAGTLALAQQHRQPDELKFCGGCHDPLLLLTGRMDEHPRPEQPGADAGITCLACHALVEAPSRLGNGSYVVAAPEHYPGYDSDDPDERERSNRLIRSKPEAHVESFGKPYGMLLVVGPTGSGKSTTLYATLNILNKPEVNIITVEDPVEYRLAGINQVQTHVKAGLTFAAALRR